MRYFSILLLLLFASTTRLTAAPPKYKLAVCALFQNEARFLKEWIEFHRLLGVERFFLYNHRSTDNYKQVLKDYVNAKIVHLIDWDFKANTIFEWEKVQKNAYNHALKHFGKHVHWMAFLDVDEFIVPMQTDNLLELLRPYEDFGGLSVNWQLFGTSGVEKIPPDKLLIEMLTRKALPNHLENCQVKVIAQPTRIKEFHNDPALPEYKDEYVQVNVDFYHTLGPKIHLPKIDLIRIHHYWTGDCEHLETIKRARWRRWYPNESEVNRKLQLLDAVEDLAMIRFVSQMRQRMGFDVP